MKWLISDLEAKTGLKFKRNTYSFGLDVALKISGYCYLKSDNDSIELIYKGCTDASKGELVTCRIQHTCDILSALEIDKQSIVVVEEPFVGFNPNVAIVLSLSAGAAYRELMTKVNYGLFIRAISARKRIGMPDCRKPKEIVHKYVLDTYNFTDISPDVVDSFVLALVGLIIYEPTKKPAKKSKKKAKRKLTSKKK